MTRTSTDEYKDGKLWNGYDYKNQFWVFEGKQLSNQKRE